MQELHSREHIKGSVHSKGIRPDQTDDAMDKRAVERTLHEDKNAFRFLVEKYTPKFISLTVKMSGSTNMHTAEEAVQEIFLRIFKSLDTFDLNKRFFPWAYTVALNYLRSEMRRAGSSTAGVDAPYNDEIGDSGKNSAYPGPEEELIRAEGERLVQDALVMLTPRYREVFVLRQIQGLSSKDTAQILDIPEGTVKTFLFRARKEIRARLKQMQWEVT